MLKLTYKNNAVVPLELPNMKPCQLRELSTEAISQTQVFHGNEESTLDEFFEISGDCSDELIEFHGDLSGVHWIGSEMKSGKILIHSNVGRHVGSEMKGGEIEVRGNCGDWVGAEMVGGKIHVHGNAGHLIGSAYRGSAKGMSGGVILIEGNGGNEIGHTMRRGLIAIGGDVGDLIGFNMLAGSIVTFGKSGIRHGAGMKRGTIALFGEFDSASVLPTFRYACQMQPTALTLLLKELSEQGFEKSQELKSFEVDLFNGDMLEGGRGEILLRHS